MGLCTWNANDRSRRFIFVDFIDELLIPFNQKAASAHTHSLGVTFDCLSIAPLAGLNLRTKPNAGTDKLVYSVAHFLCMSKSSMARNHNFNADCHRMCRSHVVFLPSHSVRCVVNSQNSARGEQNQLISSDPIEPESRVMETPRLQWAMFCGTAAVIEHARQPPPPRSRSPSCRISQID